VDRETVVVYGFAAIVGGILAVIYHPAVGAIGFFGVVGALVVGWHIGETIGRAIAEHYRKKYAPTKEEENKRSSAL
jgi:phage-related minor tail protein